MDYFKIVIKQMAEENLSFLERMQKLSDLLDSEEDELEEPDLKKNEP